MMKPASVFCLAIALTASVPPAMADDDDPPSRVARLAYTQGSVSFQPAGTDDWVTARLNRPVTTGDKLWADRDGRVELQLDGSVIHSSANSGFSFLNLSDEVTQIQLTTGTLLVRVRRLDRSEIYEIDTPNLALSLVRPGLYRISVNEAGDVTSVRVRSGEGEVTGGGATYAVHANDDVTFSGFDRLTAHAERSGGEDSFDSWAAGRDRRWENSASARYVSADVVGYEDLDDYGSWRRTPDFGDVWFPRTSVAGWAPYHYGHWAYIEPWGYTWVDDEPWGFAPFHYGRWVFFEGAWAWVPAPPRASGVVYVRPVYAPALVAWVGGPNFAVGVNVGWFPLGPREVYVPSYRVSRTYVNRVNVTNTQVSAAVVNNNVNVTNVKYVNQSVPGAVAATTPQAFTGAQPVARNAVRVDQREVANAPARASTPAVVPARQAVLGGAAAAARPPAALQTRAVVAKVAPPPPPAAFEVRQEAIKRNGGKPLSVGQARQIEPAAARREAPVRIASPTQPPEVPPPPTRRADRPGRPANPGNDSQPAPIDRGAQPRGVRPAETPAPPPPVIPPSGNANPDKGHQQEQRQQEQQRQRQQEQQQLHEKQQPGPKNQDQKPQDQKEQDQKHQSKPKKGDRPAEAKP